SLNLTTIRGGTKVNIIPDTCELMLDRRLLPGETQASAQAEITTLLNKLRAQDREFEADLTITTYCPPGEIPAEHPLVQALGAAAEKILGTPPRLKGFEATCEASLLMTAGIPTVVFGPGRIAQAHNADEYVEVQQLVTAQDIYAALARTLLAPE
ncbi:MAG TPA: M20/M25/M40 family metallo-hydrolase, partial [Firmicutes bacterium]|nr:M20/M25/M40 family metallo-hydrolase [Bacillota bacterium]